MCATLQPIVVGVAAVVLWTLCAVLVVVDDDDDDDATVPSMSTPLSLPASPLFARLVPPILLPFCSIRCVIWLLIWSSSSSVVLAADDEAAAAADAAAAEAAKAMSSGGSDNGIGVLWHSGSWKDVSSDVLDVLSSPDVLLMLLVFSC